MPTSPPFDVVVWVRKGAGFHALRDDLLRIAVDDPCASTEYEGMVDFHWRFNSGGQAMNAATALSELCAKPEVVLLRLSNYDDPTSSVTFKDERKTKH
jgi:hypothetical protein